MDIIKEERRFFKSHKIILILFALIILAIVLAIGYKMFIYSKVCQDSACFKELLVKCERASFISNNQETILKYEILREKDKKCLVNVRLIQVKQGSIELSELSGEEMICAVPINTYIQPEKNIKDCNGRLKEIIQEIMIQRMHSEIVENIGEINEEVTEVL